MLIAGRARLRLTSVRQFRSQSISQKNGSSSGAAIAEPKPPKNVREKVYWRVLSQSTTVRDWAASETVRGLLSRLEGFD